MSIFNQNVNNHPLKELLETVEDIVGTVVPQEMMHYNANPDHISHEICTMLNYENILYSHFKSYDEQKYTIYCVAVRKEGYKRRIPFYKVSFWIPELDDQGLVEKKHFTDLFVGIGGIVHERF